MSLSSLTFAMMLAGSLLFASQIAQSQQTTNTNCTLYGNTANCTSTTTDYGAQRQRDYEAGQKFGNAAGQGMSRAMEAHRIKSDRKKYCAANPGIGGCPTEDDKRLAAFNTFMDRHRDFRYNDANYKAMYSYIDVHRFDPREKKSYERAYNDMKKAGQLDLYAK